MADVFLVVLRARLLMIAVAGRCLHLREPRFTRTTVEDTADLLVLNWRLTAVAGRCRAAGEKVLLAESTVFNRLLVAVVGRCLLQLICCRLNTVE